MSVFNLFDKLRAKRLAREAAARRAANPGSTLSSIGHAQQRRFVQDTAKKLAGELGKAWPPESCR